MNYRFTVVEMVLNRAEFRWKWLRILRHSFALGSVLCVLFLLAGVAMALGYLTKTGAAVSCFAGLGGLGLLAWLVVLVNAAVAAPDRHWLARLLERVDRRLLDRLNTLLFLEPQRRDPRARSFAERIARQTHDVVSEKPLPHPFTTRRVWTWFFLFSALLAGTVVFYRTVHPWQRMTALQTAMARQQAEAAKTPDLALPPASNVEQTLPWGEVRITDPGTDLKVTKVDVVPLQIEAAANQPLKSVAWLSTVNGGAEATNDLPPPREPRYAAYQPLIYLDEYRLSDWDVLTYYARAQTDKQSAFASEVYFLEVRPFREDILKLPGGQNGAACRTLQELSALISRQQHIIRQTHHHLQRPQDQEALQAADRKKLADAETDLSEATRHLYAKMAADMENQPIGEALDNLAKAETDLAQAGQLLRDQLMNEAQNKERGGLADLVAARKMFQKAVSDHPEAFPDQPDQEPAPPVADLANKLARMEEFRNEAKAAQEFVDQAVQQQRKLEDRLRLTPRNDQPKLAEEERRLEESVQSFEEQHPQVFKGAEKQSRQARESLSKAAGAMENKTTQARTATQQATRDLEQLGQALKSRATEQQLADAYKLKSMLDRQIDRLEQGAKTNAQSSPQPLQATAREAQQTVNQLKKTVEREPARDAFGPELRDSLSGQNKVDIDARLNRLEQAPDSASAQQRAGDAAQALARVSKAFEASQPEATRMARDGESPNPNGTDSLSQGMAELDSLVKQLENQRNLSPEDQAKQGRQALYNLRAGLQGLYGDNQRASQILLRLEQVLQGSPLDAAELKRLMEQIQLFSVETSEKLARQEEKPELSNIDPTRLPAAYRGRIQKYFQKLSEK